MKNQLRNRNSELSSGLTSGTKSNLGLHQKLDNIFPEAPPEPPIKSYSSFILAAAGIAFVGCFALFLYGVINS